EYMFVGTGAGEKDNHISLLCDMYRIKKDDFIFFYIEGNKLKKGRFFGIFRAVDNNVYHLTGDDAKTPDLPKKLIYRKSIIPYKVYPKGVLEWIALDKLPIYAREVMWTLIYRKMKGGRGNTMLFPWEVEKLIKLIEDENKGNFLKGENFNFDIGSFEIVKDTNIAFSSGNILKNKKVLNAVDVKLGENYFQAYILQNLSLFNNDFYPEIFGKNIVWIGNEVYAGSGMQKIDLLTIEKLDETSFIYRIIELKHFKSSDNIENAPSQLKYYLEWAIEKNGGHLIGSREYNIMPILLVFSKKNNSIPDNIIKEIEKLKNISLGEKIYQIYLNKF
ncbi:MAG: hypothetical protein DSY53_01935, partial [Persephonella sp.]